MYTLFKQAQIPLITLLFAWIFSGTIALLNGRSFSEGGNEGALIKPLSNSAIEPFEISSLTYWEQKTSIIS